jgi:hypothetical protein
LFLTGCEEEPPDEPAKASSTSAVVAASIYSEDLQPLVKSEEKIPVLSCKETTPLDIVQKLGKINPTEETALSAKAKPSQTEVSLPEQNESQKAETALANSSAEVPDKKPNPGQKSLPDRRPSPLKRLEQNPAVKERTSPVKKRAMPSEMKSPVEESLLPVKKPSHKKKTAAEKKAQAEDILSSKASGSEDLPRPEKKPSHKKKIVEENKPGMENLPAALPEKKPSHKKKIVEVNNPEMENPPATLPEKKPCHKKKAPAEKKPSTEDSPATKPTDPVDLPLPVKKPSHKKKKVVVEDPVTEHAVSTDATLERKSPRFKRKSARDAEVGLHFTNSVVLYLKKIRNLCVQLNISFPILLVVRYQSISVWGHRRGGGLRQIFTCRNAPLQVNF